MAPQKYQKDKLVEVAEDGFALLDEFYGHNKKSGGSLLIPTTQAYDHNQNHYWNDLYNNQYLGRQVIMTIREPVIDSNQAAQFYGGFGIVDYSIRKPIRGGAYY